MGINVANGINLVATAGSKDVEPDSTWQCYQVPSSIVENVVEFCNETFELNDWVSFASYFFFRNAEDATLFHLKFMHNE